MYPVTRKVHASPAKQAPVVLASPAKLARSIPPLNEVGTLGVPPLNECGTGSSHVLDVGRGKQAAQAPLRTGPYGFLLYEGYATYPPGYNGGLPNVALSSTSTLFTQGGRAGNKNLGRLMLNTALEPEWLRNTA